MPSIFTTRSEAELTANLVPDLEAIGARLLQLAMLAPDDRDDIRHTYMAASSAVLIAARKCRKQLYDHVGDMDWLLTK